MELNGLIIANTISGNGKNKKKGNQMKRLIIGVTLAVVSAGCVSRFKNDGGDANLRPEIVRDIAYEKYSIDEDEITSVDQRIGILFPFGWLTGEPIIIGGLAGHFADNVDQGWSPYTTARMAKNGAYAAACEAAKCDSIVGARYDVVYKNYLFWDQATVTVKGHPARFKGIEYRPAAVK